MNAHDRLAIIVKKLVQERIKELEEISTSDGAGAYLTPGAFGGGTDAGKRKQRQNSEKLGYKLTKQGLASMDRADKLTELSEAVSRYHQFVKDPRTPRHKIGKSISEINRHLDEISKILTMNVRLKKESNVTTSQYWKRTMGQIGKVEQKLLRVAQKMREMKI